MKNRICKNQWKSYAENHFGQMWRKLNRALDASGRSATELWKIPSARDVKMGSSGQISKVLDATHRPKFDQIHFLATQLGLSLDYLVDDHRSEPGESAMSRDEMALIKAFRALARRNGLTAAEAIVILQDALGRQVGRSSECEPGDATSARGAKPHATRLKGKASTERSDAEAQD